MHRDRPVGWRDEVACVDVNSKEMDGWTEARLEA